MTKEDLRDGALCRPAVLCFSMFAEGAPQSRRREFSPRAVFLRGVLSARPNLPHRARKN